MNTAHSPAHPKPWFRHGMVWMLIAGPALITTLLLLTRSHGLAVTLSALAVNLGLVVLAFAGSDFLLMPSRYEPCGLSQMYAQRYASLPIARRTGGLADSIDDGISGFLFDQPSVDSYRQAVERALDVHRILRRQAHLAAIDGRAELHALLRDLSQVLQAEDLEAAGIREDGARPADVFVQAAEIAVRVVTAQAWIDYVAFCCFDSATADLYRALIARSA